MRINKFLSEAGIVSRRGADKWINDGRVTINGKLAELGSKVEAGDDVKVDGKPIEVEQPLVYLALNKPVGITSTTERHIKGNIVEGDLPACAFLRSFSVSPVPFFLLLLHVLRRWDGSRGRPFPNGEYCH